MLFSNKNAAQRRLHSLRLRVPQRGDHTACEEEGWLSTAPTFSAHPRIKPAARDDALVAEPERRDWRCV
jgi:hypothetical protein